jgi:hypothetical protein
MCKKPMRATVKPFTQRLRVQEKAQGGAGTADIDAINSN